MELARVFKKYQNSIKTTQKFLCCISFLPRNVHIKPFSIHSVSEPRKATLAGGHARREARLQLHLAPAAAFLAARSGGGGTRPWPWCAARGSLAAAARCAPALVHV